MKKKSIEFSLKAEKKEFPIEKITTSSQAYEYAKKFYFDDINIFESVFIILLNCASNTIGYAKISQGGVACCIVDKMIVAKYAVDVLASQVILVHNHPSGRTNPSNEDKNMTRDVGRALEAVGSKLTDHIIITEDGYYSFAEEGMLYM